MPSRRYCLFPAVFAAAMVTLGSLPAHAVPTAKDREDAKAAIAEARVAIGLNRFADAARALRRADELDPNPQTKMELADALVSGGKLIEATQVLNLVIDSSPPPPKKLKDSATKMRESLEQRIPWIQIKVFGPSQDLTSTTIDGKDIDASSEIPFNPGLHVIGADADGWAPVEKKIKLAEGAHKVVKIKMKRSNEAKKKASDDEDVDESSEDSSEDTDDNTPAKSGKVTSHSLFIPGVVVGGAGVVGLGVGAIFGSMALGTASDLEQRCHGTTCPDTRTNRALQEDSLSQGTVSTAMFIVGGIAAVTGGVFLTVALTSSGSTSKEKAFVVPYVGPGSVGMVGKF